MPGFITYGGVSTLLPDPEVEGWVNRNVNMGFAVEFYPVPSAIGSHAGPSPAHTTSPAAGGQAAEHAWYTGMLR
jgi:hypothetical protein